MALVRKATDSDPGEHPDERRQHERDLPALLADLNNPDPAIRRWAARDLGGRVESAEGLCDRLPQEHELAVREAIMDSLLQIGGRVVVEALIPMLRSDDAALRNGVIEVLQGLPDAVAPHMEDLLRDPDSDVRIFAIDILQVLQHPQTPEWLMQVIRDESHVNVVGTAIDRLAEVGTPEMLPALGSLRQRWADQPYIQFAIDAAVQRISGQ